MGAGSLQHRMSSGARAQSRRFAELLNLGIGIAFAVCAVVHRLCCGARVVLWNMGCVVAHGLWCGPGIVCVVRASHCSARVALCCTDCVVAPGLRCSAGLTHSSPGWLGVNSHGFGFASGLLASRNDWSSPLSLRTGIAAACAHRPPVVNNLHYVHTVWPCGHSCCWNPYLIHTSREHKKMPQTTFHRCHHLLTRHLHWDTTHDTSLHPVQSDAWCRVLALPGVKPWHCMWRRPLFPRQSPSRQTWACVAPPTAPAVDIHGLPLHWPSIAHGSSCIRLYQFCPSARIRPSTLVGVAKWCRWAQSCSRGSYGAQWGAY